MKLPKVPKEIFDKMIDNTGTSVSQYNQKGFKVLLFFSSFLGCPYCQGTLDDIVDLQDQLLLLNVIPIVVHNENQKTYDEWLQQTEKTKKLSNKLLYLQTTQEIKRSFRMRSTSVLEIQQLPLKRIGSRGLKAMAKFITKETARLLAACFVVSNGQVISEFGKDRKHQRFDLARIAIDTDGTVIEVHTDIFACEIRKKNSTKKDNAQKRIQKIDHQY
eukprot:gene1332-11414_t